MLKGRNQTGSPTVPREGQTEADVLDVRAEAWNRRALLREIYRRYFAEMVEHFARRAGASGRQAYGRVVEVGGGAGNFKSFFPDTVVTDVVATRHVDLAVDALRMAFADGTIDNLVMQDVLHHLKYPLAFLREARRVLRPGGRLVMTEPYISPASRVVFKLAHPEPVDMKAKLFGEGGEELEAFAGEGAFASNQAIPTLLFFRDAERLRRSVPGMEVKGRLLRSLVVYPLSGGFSGPVLIPNWLAPCAWTVEAMAKPLSRLLAFRLLVVLEKTA